VNSLAVSADGRRLLSGSYDHTVRVWDVESGKPLHVLSGHEDWVIDVDLSPDGRVALSGDDDGRVRLWDVEMGKSVHTMKGHEEGVTAVGLSRDGRQALTTGVDRTLRLWDVATGQQLRAFPQQQTIGVVAAFSADGRRAVSVTGWKYEDGWWNSAGYDHFVRLCDVRSGQELGRFEGHTLPLNAVFSADGGALFTCWEDGTFLQLQIAD
jgi:WD40 repeat protein